MSDEIEAKFKVNDFAAVRGALKAAGSEYLGTVLQTDCYYDKPCGVLLKSDMALRVRMTKVLRKGRVEIDKRSLLTLKGPAKSKSRVKIRSEVQSYIDNPEALADALALCGLKAMFTVQKRRASYKFGRCLVELDELPVIGRFVEIEASSESMVVSAARRLGLEGKPIKQHYIALLCGASKRIASGHRNRVSFPA